MPLQMADSIAQHARDFRVCPICHETFGVGKRGQPTRRQKHCSRACGQKSRMKCPMPVTLAPVQAAYVAGLIDGEGSIILHAKKGLTRCWCLRVTVTNTHRGILEWLCSTTGTGRIYDHNPGNEKHSPSWNWYCTSRSAVALLEQLLPYLIIKKERAVDAIARTGTETQS